MLITEYSSFLCNPAASLQAKLSAAQASVQGGPDLGEVGPLLGKAASAYRRLYSSAAAAGLEVPYEANLNNVGSLVWLEQLMVSVTGSRVLEGRQVGVLVHVKLIVSAGAASALATTACMLAGCRV